MARQEKQKTKLLVLLRILQQQSDEDHLLTVPQLVRALQRRGVAAERKSVYADIAALQDLGYNIQLRRGPGGGYFLAEREFQLAELKLLVDAVQASRFITQRKSNALIKKLESLTSVYEARALQRQVYVHGRAKSMNETAYYAVDALYQAIAADKMVEFGYVDVLPDKRRSARRGGQRYQVSPWALAWENNTYYLIAYQDYEAPAGLRHYRVDRMTGVTALDAPRCGREAYQQLDLASYMQKMFGMFGGREERVTLRCENRMAGAMLDRFGAQVIFVPEPDGQHFHLTVPVAVSPQFFGWVCGFGGAVTVAAPAAVRAELAALGRTLTQQYAPAE